MFDRVLVAVDESASSDNTFLCALELTKVLDAEMVIVHVLDMFDSTNPFGDIISAGSYLTNVESPKLEDQTDQYDESINNESCWREFSDHAEVLLKQKQTEAESFGLTARYLQPYGRAGPIICKIAETIHADLIVVGSRNYVHFSKLILGSVSGYILHNSPCSVTVIYWQSANSPVLRACQ
ncbi:MAG: universal stress protein [Phormidesmis sp.]